MIRREIEADASTDTGKRCKIHRYAGIQDMTDEHWDTLSTKFRVFAASFIDSAFLAIWALCQFGVNWIVGKLALSGFNLVVLRFFEGMFAISTLVPVVVYIVQDAARLIFRAKRTIRREMNLSEDARRSS